MRKKSDEKEREVKIKEKDQRDASEIISLSPLTLQDYYNEIVKIINDIKSGPFTNEDFEKIYSLSSSKTKIYINELYQQIEDSKKSLPKDLQEVDQAPLPPIKQELFLDEQSSSDEDLVETTSFLSKKSDSKEEYNLKTKKLIKEKVTEIISFLTKLNKKHSKYLKSESYAKAFYTKIPSIFISAKVLSTLNRFLSPKQSSKIASITSFDSITALMSNACNNIKIQPFECLFFIARAVLSTQLFLKNKKPASIEEKVNKIAVSIYNAACENITHFRKILHSLDDSYGKSINFNYFLQIMHEHQKNINSLISDLQDNSDSEFIEKLSEELKSLASSFFEFSTSNNAFIMQNKKEKMLSSSESIIKMISESEINLSFLKTFLNSFSFLIERSPDNFYHGTFENSKQKIEMFFKHTTFIENLITHDYPAILSSIGQAFLINSHFLDYRKINTTLNTLNQQLKITSKNLEDSSKKLDKIKSLYSKLLALNGSLKKENEQRYETIEELTGQLLEKSNLLEIIGSIDDLNNLISELEKNKKFIVDLEQESIAQANKSEQLLEAEIIAFEKEKKDMLAKAKSLQEKNSILKKEISKLQSSKSKANNRKFAILKTEIEELSKQIQSAKEKIACLEKEKSTTSSLLRDEVHKYKQAEVSINRTNARINELERDIKIKEEENKRLKDIIKQNELKSSSTIEHASRVNLTLQHHIHEMMGELSENKLRFTKADAFIFSLQQKNQELSKKVLLLEEMLQDKDREKILLEKTFMQKSTFTPPIELFIEVLKMKNYDAEKANHLFNLMNYCFPEASILDHSNPHLNNILQACIKITSYFQEFHKNNRGYEMRVKDKSQLESCYVISTRIFNTLIKENIFTDYEKDDLEMMLAGFRMLNRRFNFPNSDKIFSFFHNVTENLNQLEHQALLEQGAHTVEQPIQDSAILFISRAPSHQMNIANSNPQRDLHEDSKTKEKTFLLNPKATPFSQQHGSTRYSVKSHSSIVQVKRSAK